MLVYFLEKMCAGNNRRMRDGLNVNLERALGSGSVCVYLFRLPIAEKQTTHKT